jgi:tRNA-intron endonuclease
MIQAHFSGDSISSNSAEAFSLCEKSSFGEKAGQKIEYANVEALFLAKEGRMEIFSGKNAVKEEAILKKLKKHDKKIETKLAVYSDLRKRGYVPKTALKYGADFRVYDKGIKPGDAHARWILFAVKQHDALDWHDFAAKNRIAHSTKKNLLIAIVDEEGDVSYYEVSWIKP